MAIATLTPAQKSVQKKMHSLLEKVGEPFYGYDMPKLIEILSNVQTKSPWSIAIKHTFETKGDTVELINQLASQAVDDPFTMMKIVGFEGTVLLLKYFPR